ncbi:MAG: hypothetical protein OXP12_01395 [Thaumarchaeota archaeon]|nr:hypothetical protein [Nitrososphaerota archaeon]
MIGKIIIVLAAVGIVGGMFLASSLSDYDEHRADTERLILDNPLSDYVRGGSEQPDEPEEVWNTAGAFGINKEAYRLGEDVFFAGTLTPGQQVIIRVASPEGKIFLERAYDGSEREVAKFYFRPDTSAIKGLYEEDQLVGQWMIWFEGINNDEIFFEVVDEFAPGAETDVVDLQGPPAGDPGQ